MLKAALHVHSLYSDGEFSLQELKEVYRDLGVSVICMADHDDYFDSDKLASYISECAALSDDKFIFICGLEYRCVQEMHILGYGSTVLANTKDPQSVIRHIAEHGGIPVIAHPEDSMFQWIESFETLPIGIETWNSKYDGQYAPRAGTFDLLHRLRAHQPQMRAFYGQDMHWKTQFRGLTTHLDCTALDRRLVLDTLASGRYSGVKGETSLSSLGELSPELVAEFVARHAKSEQMRAALKAGRSVFDKVGVKPPAFLKSQARRFF